MTRKNSDNFLHKMSQHFNCFMIKLGWKINKIGDILESFVAMEKYTQLSVTLNFYYFLMRNYLILTCRKYFFHSYFCHSFVRSTKFQFDHFISMNFTTRNVAMRDSPTSSWEVTALKKPQLGARPFLPSIQSR